MFYEGPHPVGQASEHFPGRHLGDPQAGTRYIWIDSLCIVQDDAEDWEREAAKMALIFEAAYLTIAATAATNGTVCISSDH